MSKCIALDFFMFNSQIVFELVHDKIYMLHLSLSLKEYFKHFILKAKMKQMFVSFRTVALLLYIIDTCLRGEK